VTVTRSKTSTYRTAFLLVRLFCLRGTEADGGTISHILPAEMRIEVRTHGQHVICVESDNFLLLKRSVLGKCVQIIMLYT
jgi:hypothetical protein